jgi:hypothetical protein
MKKSYNRGSTSRGLGRKVIYSVVLALVVTQAIVLYNILLRAPAGDQSPSHLQPPGVNSNMEAADGFFNNIPVSLQTSPFHSAVHCVGETHEESTAWMYRSCHFSQICVDIKQSEFVLIRSPHEQNFEKRRTKQSFVSTSSTNTSVAIGGINPRWEGKDFNQGIDKVRWFPRILDEPPSAYYQLPPNVVLVPFHSMAAHNVGHLLWDDLLPIYTLLEMFGLIQYQHLLLRFVTPGLLYGTCEMRRKKVRKCAQNFEKFLPLIGVNPKTFSTTRDMKFQRIKTTDSAPTLVCAKQGVAGLGMLTDHGNKDHGWNPQRDKGLTTQVQNVGRGSLLYSFRNYMVHNLGFPLQPSKNEVSIVFSVHSSGDVDRDLGFENQYHTLRKAFPATSIRLVEMANMTVAEQVRLASTTSVFITTCGGGAMTATFLPRGASLILYYKESGGFDFGSFNLTGGAAYLDWDLFNNAAYLRVHWLPIGGMETQEGLESLMYLIRHEMDVSSMLQ